MIWDSGWDYPIPGKSYIFVPIPSHFKDGIIPSPERHVWENPIPSLAEDGNIPFPCARWRGIPISHLFREGHPDFQWDGNPIPFPPGLSHPNGQPRSMHALK